MHIRKKGDYFPNNIPLEILGLIFNYILFNDINNLKDIYNLKDISISNLILTNNFLYKFINDEKSYFSEILKKKCLEHSIPFDPIIEKHKATAGNNLFFSFREDRFTSTLEVSSEESIFSAIKDDILPRQKTFNFAIKEKRSSIVLFLLTEYKEEKFFYKLDQPKFVPLYWAIKNYLYARDEHKKSVSKSDYINNLQAATDIVILLYNKNACKEALKCAENKEEKKQMERVIKHINKTYMDTNKKSLRYT